MINEIKEKILRIIKECLPESPCLEYKVMPYKEDDKLKKADLLKDVCAFLNCTESYGEDKFIIYGIADKTLYKRGINDCPMEDDSKYQMLFDIIQPRPHIETGTISDGGLDFGFIYISKDNTERVYSFNKDYPDEFISEDEEKTAFRKKVYGSTAFIRKGTTKYFLNEYDRRKIYEQDNTVRTTKGVEKKPYFLSITNDEDNEILKYCVLFGTWDERNDHEKKLISDFIGVEYDIWIKAIKRLLKSKSGYVSYRKGVWKIEQKEYVLELNSEDYFPSDIEKFNKIIEELFLTQEINTGNDTYYKKISETKYGEIYSAGFKKSIIETVAILKSIKTNCINCINEIEKSTYYIVNKLLNDIDYNRILLLDEFLPILAEINANEFLRQINKLLEINDMEQVFEKTEGVLADKKICNGLLWSLELIAWNPQHLMSVYDILSKIEKYDEEVLQIMARILLPWYPQTKSEMRLRIATIKMVLNEYDDVGWKLLMMLMPHKIKTSYPTYKPKWNDLVEENEEILNKDVYEQYDNLIELAIEFCGYKIIRLLDIIGILEFITKSNFNKICELLVSDFVMSKSDEEKYELWNFLENIIVKHKRFFGLEWALPEEAINKLTEVSNKLKPNDMMVCHRRIFNTNYLDLMEENDNFDEQENDIFLKQIKIIKDIYNTNFKKVIEFAEKIKDKEKIGRCLACIKISKKEQNEIIKLIDTKNAPIAIGYIKKKEKIDSMFINDFDFNVLTLDGKVNILINLSPNCALWDKVCEILGENEKEYWKSINIRTLNNEKEYNYAFERLLENNRSVLVIELINMALHQNIEFKRDFAVLALKMLLKSNVTINYIDRYNIKKIIKDLQHNNYNEKELLSIEWQCLELLNYESDYRPITIEKRLSEEPKFFGELICMAYKAHSDEFNKDNPEYQNAINAYRALSSWKIPPGLNEDGIIDSELLKKWNLEMRNIAIEKDRLKIALYNLGRVLFYAPKDQGGFWIDKSVAELLNESELEEARNGFGITVFNSVGVVNFDYTGSVWLNLEKEWEEKAKETELQGFHRFAKSLRNVANQFHQEAKREIDMA